MSGKIEMPPRLREAISDRVNGMDPERRDQFAIAMNKLNAHLASMTEEERKAFAAGIEELGHRTQNGEELTEEDLEAVSGGVAWKVLSAWIVDNLDWTEFKKGVVDAWNET